jgi:hypothetical protein
VKVELIAGLGTLLCDNLSGHEDTSLLLQILQQKAAPFPGIDALNQGSSRTEDNESETAHDSDFIDGPGKGYNAADPSGQLLRLGIFIIWVSDYIFHNMRILSVFSMDD